MHYRIGTRGSLLALAQTGHVCDALRRKFPQHTFEIVVVKTTGDRVSQISLREVGATGIFTRELEEQLTGGTIDLAVHSMKDLPAVLPEGLSLSSVLPREDPRDTLITPDGRAFRDLPQGATVGTGSLRRKYQMLAMRPDLNVVDIRGNIDTRIQKMHDQHMDGIVLAAAALNRLELKNAGSRCFTKEELIPAPTQGILGAEYVTARTDVAELLAAIRDEETQTAADAERAFLAIMHVGCHMPVAAHWTNGCLHVMYGQEDGSNLQFVNAPGETPRQAAQTAAAMLHV